MSIYTVGQTALLELGPVTDEVTGDVYDPDPLTLTVTQPDGTEAHSWTYGTDSEIVRDSLGNFHALIPLTTGGMWRTVWAWGDGDETGESNLSLWVEDGAAFATVDQVERRIGRDLTATERIQAGQLLVDATSLIADAVKEDEAWATALDPIPARLRVICIEASVRVLQNPKGAKSQQERLGEYSHAETFSADSAETGLFLTEREERQARKAVAGTSFIAATLESPYSGDITDDDELPLS